MLSPNECTETGVVQIEGVVGTKALRQEVLGIYKAKQGKCVCGRGNGRENVVDGLRASREPDSIELSGSLVC